MPPDDGSSTGRRAAEVVRGLLRDVPDFPVPGVVFRDITPVLADPAGLRACVDGLVSITPVGSASEVTLVAGVEARGFVLGSPLALALGIGFVPVRKVGKLPGPTVTTSYDLEYGTAEIEVRADAFAGRPQVVVLDDVLATGGTAEAACRLVESAGGEVAAVVVLLEIAALAGRDRLVGRDVRALLTL